MNDGMVTLRCPMCRKEIHVAREANDPPSTVLVQLNCEECGAGDFASPSYFNAAGQELDWETGQPWPNTGARA